MMPYIINAGLVLTGCLAFYKIFLQKETFYKLNRAVLLACLAIAFTLPLIPVPQELSIRKSSISSTEDSKGIVQRIESPSSQQRNLAHWENNSVIRNLPEQKPEAPLEVNEAISPLSRQADLSKTEPAL